MNLKIKFRESFRPFAPSVQREHLSEWFELDVDSPYMLLVADVAQQKRIASDGNAAHGFDKLKVRRSEIPAVTHVDGTARVQTVTRETNPLYWEIIDAFRKKTAFLYEDRDGAGDFCVEQGLTGFAGLSR